MQEIQFRSLGWEDPLEKGMAIHSSILVWRIPWTEEPGGLQYMELWRVAHDWATTLSSVQFSRSVMGDSLQSHESQHARPPCPSPTVSDAIQPSHPLSSPSPPVPNPSQHQSFPMSQLFAWGGQSPGVSALASFLPKNTQGWSPLERSGWISLQSKGLSRIFSNTTVQKHQFFGAELSS